MVRTFLKVYMELGSYFLQEQIKDIIISGPGAARTILPFHTISVRPSKQPCMVGSTLVVYIFGLIFVSAGKNKRHHHHHLHQIPTPTFSPICIAPRVPRSSSTLLSSFMSHSKLSSSWITSSTTLRVSGKSRHLAGTTSRCAGRPLQQIISRHTSDATPPH